MQDTATNVIDEQDFNKSDKLYKVWDLLRKRGAYPS